MDLTQSILIYIGVVILTLLIFLRLGRTGISSLILSLLIGFLVELIISPPSKISPLTENDSMVIIYYLIMIATPLIIAIYAIYMAWHDLKYDGYCNV